MPIFALLPLSPLRPKARASRGRETRSCAAPGSGGCAGGTSCADTPRSASSQRGAPSLRSTPMRRASLGSSKENRRTTGVGFGRAPAKPVRPGGAVSARPTISLRKTPMPRALGWRAAIFTSTSRASPLPRRGTEVRLDAEDLDAGLGQRRQSVALEHHRRAREDAVGQVQCLAARVAAVHGPQLSGAETIGPGHTPCSCPAHRAPGRRHAHAIRRLLVELHAGKIADDVRQHVGLRVTDLVEHLLAHGATADQATSASWLAHHDIAVAATSAIG
jgi:hypothetical protein